LGGDAVSALPELIAEAAEGLVIVVRDYGRRAGDDDALLPADQQEPLLANAMRALELLGVKP
jgi:hypothetical protein